MEGSLCVGFQEVMWPRMGGTDGRLCKVGLPLPSFPLELNVRNSPRRYFATRKSTGDGGVPFRIKSSFGSQPQSYHFEGDMVDSRVIASKQ